MIQNNICAQTDFYKYTHWKQYVENLVKIYSYCESRQGAVLNEIRLFGLVPLIREFLEGQVVTMDKINEAEEIVAGMGGYKEYFNREMWEHILYEHDGHLPILIKALPEGRVVKPGTPQFTIESLDEKCVPLVNHCETLLMHVWGMTTVASVGHYLRQEVAKSLRETGTPELLPFMIHDFGYRGVSSNQTAGFLGMAFLSSGAVGTDTTEAVRYIRHYYDTDKIYGKSVWATEHSVATSFGPGRGEFDYVMHQLHEAPDDAVISLVGDSYDIYNFTENVVGSPEIMEKIKAREGRFVVRPDSGVPDEVVNRLLNILGNKFGVSYVKGYKVINHNVGILQGDGMDLESIPALYKSINANGWSADNLVVGSGGGLLQKWNRDSLRYAIKASYGEKIVDGMTRPFDIFKDPVTANTGADTKASKRGILKVQGDMTFSSSNMKKHEFNMHHDDLQPIFKHGVLDRSVIDFDAIVNR